MFGRVRSGSGKAASLLVIALVITGAACSSHSDKATSSSSNPTTTVRTARTTASSGCTTPHPATPGQRLVQTTSDGVARTYYLYVPHRYRAGTPLPLVVDFHGYLQGALLQSKWSGLGPFGDTHGFITVTPQGSGSPVQWDTRPTSADMKYVGHLLDEVEAKLCIDTARVYATGLSNGAMMTSAVPCVYAARFAAVAPVAGIQTPPGCAPSRPVPVVAFHGTADPYLAYTGGLGPIGRTLPAADGSHATLAQTGPPPGWQVPDVPDAAATWAKRNGCADVVAHDKTIATDVTLRTFGCPSSETVELYTIKNGGHTWPGSRGTAALSALGKTTMSISADEVMWAFFQAHPLASAR